MQIQVEIVSAFIDGETGGNLAGVVLEGDTLDTSKKQAVAQAVGLSETAFVSFSKTAGFKLEFFTPQRQIAHCGHATIATFNLLKQRRLIADGPTSKETIDGIRTINIRDDSAFMQQRPPTYHSVTQSHDQIMAALGIRAHQIIAEPMRVDTGNGFIVVALDSLACLSDVAPKKALLSILSEKYDLVGFYAFCPQTYKIGRDASTRMFAPRYGITEESATGMAAGPLACFMHDKLGVIKENFVIEQGYAMKPASPSVITVNLQSQHGKICDVYAGGKARQVDSIIVQI